jgi:hypothetical protein
MYVGGRYVHDQHGDSLCNRHCLYV